MWALLNILKNNLQITLLLIIGFIIRYIPIYWGFPGTFHNDESNVVRTSLGMRFGDYNPHHFDWPSLYFYINFAVFYLYIKFRTVLQILFTTNFLELNFPFFWGPDLPFYLLARLISTFFSLGTCLLVYIIARLYFDKKTAMVAAVFSVIGLVSVRFSLYGITDHALAFFMTLSFYYSVKILKVLTDNKNLTRYYVLAGTFAGLATSIKYNGFLSCLVIFLVTIFTGKIISKRLVYAATAAIIAFFITSPYTILDFDTFMRTDSANGAMWQISHMGKDANWAHQLFVNINNNFGFGFSLLSIIGVFYLLTKPKLYKFLALTFIYMFLYIGSWGIAREHYLLPVLPYLCLSGAYIIDQITALLVKKINLHKPSLIFWILTIAICIQPIFSVLREIKLRTNLDTRIESANYIKKNYPYENTQIIVLDKTHRQGIFGGDLPVLEYNKYKKLTLTEKGKIDPNKKHVFIDIQTDEEMDHPRLDKFYTNYKYLTSFGDSMHMGPKIILYEYNTN